MFPQYSEKSNFSFAVGHPVRIRRAKTGFKMLEERKKMIFFFLRRENQLAGLSGLFIAWSISTVGLPFFFFFYLEESKLVNLSWTHW